MNVLLTNKCNRQCKYCFAEERVYYQSRGRGPPKSSPSYISRENFGKVLNFARDSKQHRISLLGGEPSLHPEFDRILQRAWDEMFNLTVFTNGIWSEEAIAFVEKANITDNRKLNLVVNVNQPEDTPENEKKGTNSTVVQIG